MRNFIKSIAAAFALMLFMTACETPAPVYTIAVQLYSDGKPFAREGVHVSLSDAAGTAVYDMVTDGDGVASFLLLEGSYNVSSTFQTVEDGVRAAYSGSANGIIVSAATAEQPVKLELQKVVTQQIIIKELYNGGCPKNDLSGAYSNDSYIILYNNSEFEADASDIVIGNLNPYNGHAINKYYSGESLIYAAENWIPAGGAAWYFKSPVTIPPYSQIVIAVFGAIDHTATVSASVNLANADYYWMSNSDIPAFKNAKYAVSEVIPTSHYLSGYGINQGNAWVLSNSSPALYIAKMPHSQLQELCTNTAAFDLTGGTNSIGWAVKFPKANVIGALEAFSAANIEKSLPRFSSDLNNGAVSLTNQKGYSIYRNVDKEATEALPENAGKLVYGYKGTEDVGGSTDPSGIDAEASAAAGAHIIYKQTLDCSKDFHQRRVASLKK